MSHNLRLLERQSTYSLIGLCLFIGMAGLGWIKLRYGFNFIDEGMYMADG